LFVLCSFPALAQDTHMYEDPTGRFSIPIPSDWIDKSTDGIVHFVSPEEISVSVLVTEEPDSVLTVLAPDLIGINPAQTTIETMASGTWTLNIYAPATDQFALLGTQEVKGITYALLFTMPGQDAFAAHREQILTMLIEFSTGKRLDLTGIKAKPFTNEMLADLKAYIEDARKRFHIPAASVAIVQNDSIVYTDGFGTTEADGHQPVTADTLFMIGSVTKSMTTMMMGTLVDDGILDWNQPVNDILPSFALSDPAATAQIRVRDLVNMSSGVPRYDTIVSLRDFTPQEFIASLADIPLVAAPGKSWNYSNQMVTAGGYVSALAAGVPKDALFEGYTDLVQKRVFDRIGMPHTTFDFDATIATPNHALPYTYNPITHTYVAVPPHDERAALIVAPAGAVWSNASDMARYLLTVSNDGVSPDGTQVISAEALQTTQSPEITVAGPLSYGMGWFIDSYHGLPLIWHPGDTSGFSSNLSFLPSADLGVMILTNVQPAKSFQDSVREYIFELAFGLEHSSTEHFISAQAKDDQATAEILSTLPDKPVVAEAVAPYLGVYEHNITVEMRGAELWVVAAYAEAPLHPADDIPGMEAGDYVGGAGMNPLRVRFITAGDQLSLEITNLLTGETLDFDKVK
jgi:CubicO group peptidase (beta-lactamase class C family)